MIKVITYGTFDMLHRGHVRLLERAKALGDYLIVGVTSDDYDRSRGKINVQQPLMERVEAVRQTELADEIIIEEYEGQKIDDIRRMDVDIFVLGSDWEGRFDYLREYCQVLYLPRTEGVSSSEIRTEQRKLRLGLVGQTSFLSKIVSEAAFVNGIELVGICAADPLVSGSYPEDVRVTDDYDALLDASDAVYILSGPEEHEAQIETALRRGKHVLCESPVALSREACDKLFRLAREQDCILMDGIKTAYSTAYDRLVLLAKSGKIGEIVSVDAVCTSMRALEEGRALPYWNTVCEWGPMAMLPVFQILGCRYLQKTITTWHLNKAERFDGFTKIDFLYPNAVASVKVASAAKAEGELVVAGTKGYLYVPAPWWKTDYFEVRYEDPSRNQRFFYQLDGEGIRYELVAFSKSVESRRKQHGVSAEISREISSVICDYYRGEDVRYLDVKRD